MLKSKDNLSDLLKKVCTFLDGLNKAIEINNSETGLTKRIKFLQYRSASVRNSSENNRIIPLDAITKSEFELERDTELGNTKIIYGHGSDEMLRSNGLVAFALANKIYIQTHKYKPETEEGRALLAHELTHVQQYSEKRINNQTSKEELEKEAEQVEKIIEYNPERYREINFEGKKYKLTERKYRELMDEIRKRVEYQLEYNTMGLSDADYLKVLIQYQEMEKRRELIWQK